MSGSSLREKSILAAGGIAIALCYVVAIQAPAVGLYHDDGIYLVTAKALAEGKGYRIVSLPDEIPQTKYPILFPLALSVVWRINPSFPANVTVLKLVPFAATIAWCFLVYLLLARETGNRTLARGIMILTMASPRVIHLSTTILSETLFAAFLWGGLLLLDRCERGEATNRRVFGAALLASAAFHTRTLGLALIAAGFVALGRSRGWRTGLKFGLLSTILVVPWFLWVIDRAEISPLYRYYTNVNYQDWSVLFGFSAGQKLSIVGWNLVYTLFSPAWLMGFSFLFETWPIFLVMGGLVVYGFALHMKREVNAVHLFALLYVGALLQWAWLPTRFLAPLYPLILFFAALGGRRIAAKIRNVRARRIVTVAAVVAVAFQGGWMLGRTALLTFRLGEVCTRASCRMKWEEVRSMMAYVYKTTPADAVLAGNLDPMLYLFTGRKGIRAFEQDPYLLYYTPGLDKEALGPPENLAARLAGGGADYLVTMPRPSLEELFLWRQIGLMRGLHPSALVRIDGTTPRGSRLYRIYGEELGAVLGRPAE